MNVGIISKDHLFLNKVSEKIDVLLDKYIIQKYSTFDSFLKNRRNFDIDCIFIDLSLENWLEKSKVIKDKFQNIGIVFVSDDLHDSYKVYEVEMKYVPLHILYKNRVNHHSKIRFQYSETFLLFLYFFLTSFLNLNQ